MGAHFLRFIGLSAVLLLASLTAAKAESPDLWQQANQAYRAGRFEEAKVDYLQLVSRKLYTANLFYNLANAWFKLGDKGRAILNYKRVLILQPNSPEATANLQMALRAAESEERHNFGDFVGQYADYFPLFASVFFWLSAGCALFWILGPGRQVAKRGFAIFFALFLVNMILAVCLKEGSKDPSRAVVIESAADMKFGPANSSRTVETLSTGQEIRLLSERGEWSLCQTGAGVLGWIPTRKFERLIPQ